MPATDSTQPPLEAEAQAHTAARPDRGQAEDGKGQGVANGGQPGTSQFGRGDSAGRDGRTGSETERDAPGISTDKKVDDTK